jgi:A/G-specific adenine glycosylase
VLARIFGPEGDPWPIAEELARACQSPRALNQGLMELGALVCKPRNPACLLCPLRDHCVAHATGRIDELPPPKERKATRAMRIPLYVVRDRRGRILVWRASGPLMDAMIHLPHGDDSLLDCTPIDVRRGRILGTFRHTVTTRRIEFTVYAAALRGRAPRGYRWIDPRKLPELPHPSYVKKALLLGVR